MKLRLLFVLILVAAGIAYWLSSSTPSPEETTDNVQKLHKRSTSSRRRKSVEEKLIRIQLSGIVVNKESQEPISGALLSISQRKLDGRVKSETGMSLLVKTNEEGMFLFPSLASGLYSVSVTKDSYKPSSQEKIVVSVNNNNSLRFELSPGGVICQGTVRDIGGGALAFAEVSFRSAEQLTISSFFESPFSTLTNENGHYRINLEEGNYGITASHPDYQPSTKPLVQIDARPRAIDFTLTPGSNVEGIVLRKSDNTPVPGALISQIPIGQTRGFMLSGVVLQGGVRSGDDGRFTLQGIGSGSYELRAVAPHASSREATHVELSIAESLTDVVVYVEDAYTVRGFVVSSNDKKQTEPGVMVGAYSISPGALFAATEPSSEDGSFEIHGVHPGEYTVGALGEERVPNFFGESISVVDQDLEDIIITLNSGYTLQGFVVPPGPASILLSVNAKEMGISDIMQAAGALMVHGKSKEDGSFILKGVSKGDYKIVATRKHGAGSKGTLPVSVQGDMDGLELKLQQQAQVRGQVVDQNGNTLEGYTVQIRSIDLSSSFSMASLTQFQGTKTSAKGLFVQNNLSDGTYLLTVLRNKATVPWADQQTKILYKPKDIVITNAQNVENLILRVKAQNHSIRGIVKSSDNLPAADVWVEAKMNKTLASTIYTGEKQKPVLTDSDGRFQIDGLNEGVYIVEAKGEKGRAKGKAQNVRTGTEVTVNLALLGTLKGTVNRDGKPVQSYNLSLHGHSERRIGVHQAEGNFRVPNLEAGDYTIEINSEMGTATLDTKVTSGQETPVEILLSEFGSIKGTLVDEDGNPLPAIVILTVAGQDKTQRAQIAMKAFIGAGPRTNQEGEFYVEKLAPGECQIMFIDPNSKGFLPIAQVTATLQSGEVIDIGQVSAKTKTNAIYEQQ